MEQGIRNSIRARLTGWYTGALALTLLLLGSATYLFTRSSLYHWLDETLGARAEALSEEVRVRDGRPHLDLSGQGHGPYEGVADGYLVLDRAREVVLSRGLVAERFRRAAAVETALGGWPGAGTVAWSPSGSGPSAHRWRVASQPILSHGSVAVVVLVAHDLDELDEVLERLALVLTALLPLGLGVAGFGGYVLAGRALAPVDQITRTAAVISERDLSQRLPVGTKDELGRLAATFNALIERLEHAFERQRRFTADAAHELRTPLAVIRAVTSQKLMARQPPEAYEQALRQVEQAAAYMAKLVTQLLLLARADAGQVELERERLDLAELVGHVADQVGEAAGRVVSVHAAGPTPVVGDATRLTELFLSLVENALKYTPRDGTVAVQVESGGDTATVVVRDTGIGIPPEDLPHIFERFYRVDPSRARESGGTGLGLAIGHWIVTAHGGTIRAESEPGRGTAIVVTLPVAEEP